MSVLRVYRTESERLIAVISGLLMSPYCCYQWALDVELRRISSRVHVTAALSRARLIVCSCPFSPGRPQQII